MEDERKMHFWAFSILIILIVLHSLFKWYKQSSVPHKDLTIKREQMEARIIKKERIKQNMKEVKWRNKVNRIRQNKLNG